MKSKLSAFLKTALSVFIPKLVLVPFLPARHEIDLNLDLLQAAVDYPLNRDYKTYCDYGKSHGALENFGLVPGRYIVIQPGARSGAPTPKRWSLQNFKEFIAVFEERFPDLEIVAIGNQYDYDNYVAELLKSASNIKNTAGLTTLADAATIMQHAAVSVVHDSGAMHIGGAVEAKMVALYGPTDFSRTRPLGDRCTVLFSKQESFAEMFNLSSGEDALVEKYGENYCMDGILPETVLHAVETYVIP
jgi:ADP-heptose:LPS heptosyltransferase